MVMEEIGSRCIAIEPLESDLTQHLYPPLGAFLKDFRLCEEDTSVVERAAQMMRRQVAFPEAEREFRRGFVDDKPQKSRSKKRHHSLGAVRPKRVEVILPQQPVEVILPQQRVEVILPQQRVEVILPQQRVEVILPQQRVEVILPQQRVEVILPQHISSRIHNVRALSSLITWQKVDYDFSYHQMEFPCNINVLITSEGRSLLPADCRIHLQPQIVPPNMEEYVSSLLSTVLPSVLNKFRIYLTLLRFLDYSISEEITKAVEDDFVEMRKQDPQSITADDLHQLLVVARFLSLSAGQTTLSRERWLRAKQLEALRRGRLQQQQCVNGNEL